jgi:hypothetical protein
VLPYTKRSRVDINSGFWSQKRTIVLSNTKGSRADIDSGFCSEN